MSVDLMEVMYDTIKKIDEKQDTQSLLLEELKHNVDINTKDLTEHKEGVIQNRKHIKSLEKQIDILKTPSIARAYIIKGLALVGGVSGSLYAIYRLYDSVKDLL